MVFFQHRQDIAVEAPTFCVDHHQVAALLEAAWKRVDTVDGGVYGSPPHCDKSTSI